MGPCDGLVCMCHANWFIWLMWSYLRNLQMLSKDVFSTNKFSPVNTRFLNTWSSITYIVPRKHVQLTYIYINQNACPHAHHFYYRVLAPATNININFVLCSSWRNVAVGYLRVQWRVIDETASGQHFLLVCTTHFCCSRCLCFVQILNTN